jgi:hypothetical protein
MVSEKEYLTPLECWDVWQKTKRSSLTLLLISFLQLIYDLLYYLRITEL